MPSEPFTQSELDVLASMLGAVARAEPVDAVAALAWCLVNRLEAAPSRSDEIAAIAHLLGQEGAASQGVRSAGASREALPVSHIRALAFLCLAICGDAVDPTRGATLFHRHDDWPRWAHGAEPAALAGSFFFYCDAAVSGPVAAVDVPANAR